MFDGISVDVGSLVLQNFVGLIAFSILGIVVITVAAFLLRKLYAETIGKDVSELIAIIESGKEEAKND